MSGLPSTLERGSPDVSPDTPPVSSQLLKPQRVLACVLCQQRKMKCDRKFPCANCIRSRAQCVPATLTQRRRRRRFPERELLERLRKYEDLLRQNNVAFEPLHKDPAPEKDPLIAESGYGSDDEHPRTSGPGLSTLSTTSNSERGHKAKNIWHAISQGFRDLNHDSDSSDDDVRETSIRKAWDQSVEFDDDLLFGSRRTSVDLSIIHPDPVQIFRLWQIYLDHVNPLLKVTHIPSLQGRIIEAAGNVKSIDPNLEALMFSIYCTSVLSLTMEDCQNIFGSSKADLLVRYQFGCQQALLKSVFLRSSDRDCLTAFFLYLVSVRPSTVFPSLSSMLGVAIRIAQRMGIHSEPALAKCTAFEAEMRRRLWWSLMFFDTRINELANSKIVTLDPTWDCNIPINVNDSDLRPEMKGPPVTQGKSTEALFAVVRCEIGEFIRHAAFHLDFTNPALKPVAKDFRNGLASEVGGLSKLEEAIEDQYLRSCDLENPIHFMTIWTTRTSSMRQTEAQRDTATSYALKMLECDTKIMTSPLTKGFLWLHHLQFPFPAYIQIVRDLKSRPSGEQARQAWEVMSDSYEAWFGSQLGESGFLFQIIVRIVLQAWEACEAASKQLGQVMTPPRIVLSMRNVLAQTAQHAQSSDTEQPNVTMDMEFADFPMPMQIPMSMSMPIPMGFANQSLPYSMEMHPGFTMMRPEMYSDIPRQGPSNAHMNQLDWTALGGRPGWGDR